MAKKEIEKLYKNHSFLIYISKYDGLGLTLSKGISMGQFIFCLDGLPWNELLEKYPRKQLIKCEKDGIVFSQQKYKANFDDLKHKLLEYEKYMGILKRSLKQVYYFNIKKRCNMLFLIKKNILKIV